MKVIGKRGGSWKREREDTEGGSDSADTQRPR